MYQVQALISLCSGQSFPNNNTEARSEKDGLYPLEALVQPLSLRFKYHFEGDRQTNQLHRVSKRLSFFLAFILKTHVHKPEWYFTHVLNAVNDHQNFMESIIQRLLSSTKYKSFNAWVSPLDSKICSSLQPCFSTNSRFFCSRFCLGNSGVPSHQCSRIHHCSHIPYTKLFLSMRHWLRKDSQ